VVERACDIENTACH